MTSTLTEMTKQMDQDLTGIAAAEHDLERARERFLDLTIRTGHVSAEARAIAERDHMPALQQAEHETVHAVDQAARNARQVIKALETDRLKLSPTEELTAAQRLPLIQQLAATASLPHLAGELRAALVAEDRAGMYALNLALQARMDVAPDPLDAGRPELKEARDEIRTLRDEVRHRLRDTSFDAARDRTKQVLDRATRVRMAVEARRQQAAQAADLASGRKVAWPVVDTLRRAS